MKTAINKSELFKRAWKFYRIYGVERITQISYARIKEAAKSFGWCLKKAWNDMKKMCGRSFDNMKGFVNAGTYEMNVPENWYNGFKDYHYCGD